LKNATFAPATSSTAHTTERTGVLHYWLRVGLRLASIKQTFAPSDQTNSAHPDSSDIVLASPRRFEGTAAPLYIVLVNFDPQDMCRAVVLSRTLRYTELAPNRFKNLWR
jgi:hypothetical protein